METYGLLVRSGQCAQENSFHGGRGIWNANWFPPEQEAYCTIGNHDEYVIEITLYLQLDALEIGGGHYPYYAWFSIDFETDELWLQMGHYQDIPLYDHTFDAIGLQTGDAVRFRSDGAGTLTAYYRRGGVWTQLASIVDPNPITKPGYIALEVYDYTGPGTVDDFGGGSIFSGPDNLVAHVALADIHLTWTNESPDYDTLRVERGPTREGPWTDLQLALAPTDEEATDTAPTTLDQWYRVVATQDTYEGATLPTRAEEIVRETWNVVAHAMGIQDLATPVAPFVFGEAGEQLFLVCCRLWRLAVAPDLPDPVLSNPEDWRAFLETGEYPTP